VTGSLSGGGVSATSLGNSGTRTYLTGKDGSNYHWIAAGGTAEATDLAIGFDTSAKKVVIGSGWTLSGYAAGLPEEAGDNDYYWPEHPLGGLQYLSTGATAWTTLREVNFLTSETIRFYWQYRCTTDNKRSTAEY